MIFFEKLQFTNASIFLLFLYYYLYYLIIHCKFKSKDIWTGNDIVTDNKFQVNGKNIYWSW